ncbi:MAG TPA: purine-nucleoside phosphorylase [Actinomycetota bacterium]|nr:purine-nucleoside phosphorylase [Actinomycetota bacterium]
MTGLLPGPSDALADEAAEFVRERTAARPEVAIVLGSGLGAATANLREEVSFSFGELPGFPRPTVPGHAGALVLGELSSVPVAVFRGRIHFYEGNDLSVCALPIRLARALGAGTAILTAATGGIGEGLDTGHLVVGADHLNFLGQSPLRGWRRPDGSPPFVDMVDAYDPALADLAFAAAERLGVPVSRGVYAAMPGPMYETPAEIAFLRVAGASVVGMSVVSEAVPARALGMRVLGLFFVTNKVGVPVEHQDVVRASDAMAGALGAVIEDVLAKGDRWTAT